MAVGPTYSSISTQTLTSTQATVTFSGIPSTYTDLILIIGGTNASNDQGIVTRVGNGSIDTGSNYSSSYVFGDGSSSQSGRSTNETYIIAGRMNTSSSVSIIHYMNYSNTSTNKVVLGRGNDTIYVLHHIGLWRSTVAINTLNVFNLSSVSFAAGTVLTLYGIAAA
jgi:hypothetical protein